MISTVTMKQSRMLVRMLALLVASYGRLSGAVTTEAPSIQQTATEVTQIPTTNQQVDGSNNSTESTDGSPQSPEDVDVSGLGSQDCLTKIFQFFPLAEEYATCKCLNLFCPVEPGTGEGDKDGPQTPDDVDVSGLFGEECILKIFSLFPDVHHEYLTCRCFNLKCPNQTEEEYQDNLKTFKLYYDQEHDSADDIYLAVFYVLVMVVGSVGNILVLVTVLKVFKSPNVTNMFISSLAVADLMIVLICIPFRLTDYVGRQIWDIGEATCKIVQFIYVFSFMCSVLTLTAMSLERYQVICYPMKSVSMSTPGRAKKIIAAVWVSAAVLAIPSALIAGTKHLECKIVKVPVYSEWEGYYFLYLLIVIFFVPSVLMAFAYGRTSFVLWKSISMAQQLKGDNAKDSAKQTLETKARIQVIRMLLVIWILFTLTWGSFLSFHIIRIYPQYLVISSNGDTITITNQTLNLLTMANSAVNPILYAFMSSQFRKGFIKCLSCIPIVKRKYLAPVTTTSTTGSTAIVSGTALNTISVSVKS